MDIAQREMLCQTCCQMVPEAAKRTMAVTAESKFLSLSHVALWCIIVFLCAHSAVQAQTFTGLGDLPGGQVFSSASAVSADGEVVIRGYDQIDQIRFIKATLVVLGLAYDVVGWKLQRATGISGDGLTIVGSGRNPSNRPEGWRVTLPPYVPSVPNPNPVMAPFETYSRAHGCNHAHRQPRGDGVPGARRGSSRSDPR